MQQTTNCGLKKPEANEYYNVGDFNYNADVIDAALKGLEDGKADIGPDGKVPAEQLPEIQKITVDDALSGTSTNPVQNKVVKAALDNKEGLISALTALTALADGDTIPFTDISDRNKSKKISWTNIKTMLSSLFSGSSHTHDGADIVSGLDGLAGAMGASRIQTGSYVGTGTYRSSNPCSLTFDFVPKLLYISKDGLTADLKIANTYYRLIFSALVINGAQTDYASREYMHDTTGSLAKTGVQRTWTWSGTAVSWYASGSDTQLNDPGVTYQYIAIG